MRVKVSPLAATIPLFLLLSDTEGSMKFGKGDGKHDGMAKKSKEHEGKKMKEHEGKKHEGKRKK